MSIEILLNEREVQIGLQAAMARMINADKAGYKHKYASDHLKPDYILKLNHPK